MSLLKVKEGSEKAGLKLNIQKTKIMASSSLTSWQTDRETMETVADFTFLAYKITVDSACSHEIKRCLLLARTADKPRQRIKKQRQYCANKGLYAWESWTIKKTEHQRTDAFKLVLE